MSSKRPAGNILVFDIGGTSLRCACYSPATDSIGPPLVVPTPNRILHPDLTAEQLYATVLETITGMGERVMADDLFSAVGLAFPGPVDRSGRVLAAPGIWGRNPHGPIDMAADMQQRWPGLPVSLSNDLTAAGCRYLEKGDESFCLVTISTGIGSKIFIDGKPQLGPGGGGGEIGHARVLCTPDAPICDCGAAGHLQALASGRGVLNLIRQQARNHPDEFRASRLGTHHADPDTVANSSIAEAYRVADPFTVSIINQSVAPLAAILVNIFLALGLDRFILIGGFAFALGEAYRLEIARQAADLCWDHQADWPGMLSFGYEDDLSGLVGAGRLAHHRFELRLASGENDGR